MAAYDACLHDALCEMHAAQRGVLLVGELRRAEDRAAVLRIAHALGWPIVADALSGLRIGANAPATPANAVVIHHLDTVLSDAQVGAALRPDCVLQIGGHIVSKRVLQWVADACDPATEFTPPAPASSPFVAAPGGPTVGVPTGGVPGGVPGAPAAWIYCSSDPARHDAAHLVSVFVQATPPRLADAVARYSPPLPPIAQPYRRLLAAVDAAVAERLRQAVHDDTGVSSVSGLYNSSSAAAVAAAVVPRGPVSEPAAAMALAQHLPREHGLFIGSSMPIRDLDMFSQPRAAADRTDRAGGASTGGYIPTGGSTGRSAGGSTGEYTGGFTPPGRGTAASGFASALGVPVAANRGASGIDGVLSSAAGFASGLRRPTTLLVGDVSFLHDTNGLLFLHDQELASPLTVVLINNSGGGIFHFLPVADAVDEGARSPSCSVFPVVMCC